jgi:hypothetical protein
MVVSGGRYTLVGARAPRGVMLVGPPGTGKTLLARAVAGSAGVPFFHASGSAFDDTYVGVGAARIRELFAKVRLLLFRVHTRAVRCVGPWEGMRPRARMTIAQVAIAMAAPLLVQ